VFQDDQFMKSMVEGYEAAGEKYGIKILTANTDNDQAKEAELIQTYIAQEVDGIAIAPLSPDASIANLKEAADRGIQIAVTNMNLGDMSFLAGGYTSDDTTNGKLVGTNAAEYIKENITGDVNVGRVDFDDQLPDQSKARWGGFYAGLDEGGVTYTEVAAVSSHLQDDSGDNILIAVVAQDPYNQGYKAVESLALTLLGETNPDAGKTVIVPGTYLSISDPDGVNAWRKANGLD